jgi:shikimate kinase / 3-dehydroquinate synthase
MLITKPGDPMTSQPNIVLTGFMGVGKSTIGARVAQQLGRPFIDMDAEIEARAGLSIAAIFSENGEGAFREYERTLCLELANQEGMVIATGGGTLIPSENREAMVRNGILICLTCTQDEIIRRVGTSPTRPLVDRENIQTSLASLWDARSEAYAALPWHIDTANRRRAEIVDDVLRLIHADCLPVRHARGSYPIHIGTGLLSHLGDAVRASGLPGTNILVVSNDIVFPLYGKTTIDSLKTAGYEVSTCLIPDGEYNKTLDTVRLIYDALAEHNIDRHGTIIGLGGGVTGDIAGFAAASYLRGINFVQVPTTLLAMVDASVGGKTGVDLPSGKNLVGAFKQPNLVLIDPQVLATLGIEELRSGMAEALKHGVIADPVLFNALIHEPVDHAFWSSQRASALITRALRVKISVVEEDPFEKGRRAVLNLGHTLGHALEVLSDYTLRHGHAIAIGLVAATRIAVKMTLALPALVTTIEGALQQIGLDSDCPAHTVEEIDQAMIHDKKRANRQHRWVLPQSLGHVTPDHIVPPSIVNEVLLSMGARRNNDSKSI